MSNAESCQHLERGPAPRLHNYVGKVGGACFDFEVLLRTPHFEQDLLTTRSYLFDPHVCQSPGLHHLLFRPSDSVQWSPMSTVVRTLNNATCGFSSGID